MSEKLKEVVALLVSFFVPYIKEFGEKLLKEHISSIVYDARELEDRLRGAAFKYIAQHMSYYYGKSDVGFDVIAYDVNALLREVDRRVSKAGREMDIAFSRFEMAFKSCGSVKDLESLTVAERSILFDTWNDTCIHNLQVKLATIATALITEEKFFGISPKETLEKAFTSSQPVGNLESLRSIDALKLTVEKKMRKLATKVVEKCGSQRKIYEDAINNLQDMIEIALDADNYYDNVERDIERSTSERIYLI